MSSKKKARPAAAAAKRPAKPKQPATNGERRQKANVTRFCRDVAEEYKSEYPNATVYKLRRALARDDEMRLAIITLGSRAWLRPGFRDRMEALVKNLPTTVFRRAMSSAERAEANAARQRALIDDAKGYSLSPESIHALRAAYARGLKGMLRKDAQEQFDAATAS